MHGRKNSYRRRYDSSGADNIQWLGSIAFGRLYGHYSAENQSMWAHQFLQQVPVVPLPAETMLLNTLISFVVLTGCGYLYSHLTEISVMWRSGLFLLELASCIFLMHSISLSYDGLVLLMIRI